jgi:hypothetical protein
MDQEQAGLYLSLVIRAVHFYANMFFYGHKYFAVIDFQSTDGPLTGADQGAFRQLPDHRDLVFSRSPEI